METYTEKLGHKLNDLLEKTYDAEKGFEKACENTQHTGLKNYFKHKAQERHEFGHELKSEIKSFGQEIDEGGSVAGKAHRTWMDVKSLFSTNNEEAMLEEVINGEIAAVNEYIEVLTETALPSSTKAILLKQKLKIEDGLETVKRLEDLN